MLTINPVKELANSKFEIPIVGIERRARTCLSGRWRLPTNAIPDPLRLLACSNLVFRAEGRTAAIAVGARLTIVRVRW